MSHLWRRRELLQIIAAASAANLIPTAIRAAESSQAPIRGGTLVVGVNGGDPPTYDMYAANVFILPQLLSPHYNCLLKIDAANYPKVTTDLAESWEASADFQTYTFKLHPNVHFHDGSLLTSEDVKASYDRARNPPAGVTSIRKAQFADIDQIETPDPLTVVFKLKQPSRSMPYVFASPFNVIYSAAKLKEDQTFPQRNVLGTGPFRFVEHVAGASWRGERFADYFKPNLPYLDGFSALFLTSASLLNAIQSGRVMNEFRGLTTAQRDQLVQALGDKVQVFEKPWTSTNVVTFNSQRKPFDDPRVRRALSLAIDRWGASRSMPRVSIQAFVGGYLRPGYDLAAREDDLVKMPGYSKDIEASRAEAKRLLAEAGQSNLKFKFHNRNLNDPNITAAIYLIDQWHKIGVEVEHLPLNDTVWNANISAGDFDATFENQTDPVDEPDLQLARYQSYDISGNRGRYTDRQLDEYFNQQKNAKTNDERYKFLRQFETRMLTEAYTVPFLWLDRIVVLPKTIHGWVMTSSPYVGQDLDQVWLST